MEKIQQAIERAREMRSTGTTAPPGAAARSAHPSASPAGGGSVFAQASTVPLDERRARNELLIAASGEDPRHDVFRMLRTQVLRRLQTLGGRRVAVVSARDNEGKTFVACNLAMSLARRGHGKVVLIDADLRQPSVYQRFGLKGKNDLSDVIEGHCDLGEALVSPGIENLYVLPQGHKAPHASELIGSAAMMQAMHQLHNDPEQPILVFDCSPLLQTDEPLSLLDFVDGYLIVVQEGRTQRTQLAHVSEMIGQEKYLGTVMNNARFIEATKYYGYG